MRFVMLFLALVLLPVKAETKKVLDGPFAFEVLRVIDGDTFHARVTVWQGQTVDFKVRLKGVDTPEMNGKCPAEKKLAQQAKAFATRWLDARKAKLIGVQYGTYAGRVLATTMDESGDTLSAALLAQNLAKPYRGRKAKWCA